MKDLLIKRLDVIRAIDIVLFLQINWVFVRRDKTEMENYTR
ncbi:MAG: hypothetical protein QMD14_04050 [Candidatus Aenigmarchaeota archaeon]|nr:hypothetical protein [Candidatus Aenigmarchaeota archaeon]